MEACGIARQAAKSVGAADRFKIIIIYNNITEVCKLGVKYNEWRLKCAAVSDFVGIDSYNYFPADRTDPAATIQNARFFINNYSGGKPVMMIENGTRGNSDTMDEFLGITTLEVQKRYYENLFREFRFELEKGRFLNHNLAGYLFWDLIDGAEQGEFGVLDYSGKEKPAARAIRGGIRLLEKQKQFNPSLLICTQPAGDKPTIAVESGCTYEKLTYVTKSLQGKKTLKIELEDPGTVLISINNTVNLSSSQMQTTHIFSLSEGIDKRFNVIDVYFGAEQIPMNQKVLLFELSD